MATPSAVAEIMAQLEPVLTRWYNNGRLGDIAVHFGRNEISVEERPVRKVATMRQPQTVNRAKEIAFANQDDDGQCPIGK